MKNVETEKQVATGVYIRTSKSGKKSIRVSFRYKYKYCREALKLEATTKNIKKAIQLRRKILKAIAIGCFNYTDFFPLSKNAIRFGHAKREILVSELLDQFLEQVKENVKSNTYSSYEKICNHHLKPVFGNLPVTELNAGVIWSWLKKFKCKPKTLGNILTPLRSVVADALIYGYIDTNPFGFLKLKRLRKIKSRHVVKPFKSHEIQLLLSAAEPQIKNLFQFAFYTGLRISELIGLRWEDVDFEAGFVHIRQGVVNGEVTSLKTKSSNRPVQLLPSALKALQAQKDYTYIKKSYVFFNPQTHKPWVSSEAVRRQAWKPLLEKTGIEYRNLYQTRHTYASMMVSAGENFIWVSKQMGHETTQTTARFYARWIPNPQTPGGYKPVNEW